MRRTRWPKTADVVDLGNVREANLNAERIANYSNVTRLEDNCDERPTKRVRQALALSIVPGQATCLDQGEALLIEWLSRVKHNEPLSYSDIRMLAEVILKIVIEEGGEFVTLIRFDDDLDDDDDGSRLAEAG